MDINKNEPFKRIIFDVAKLIKNTFDYSSTSADNIEITNDEFFTRINNLKSDTDLIKILEFLKTNKIINNYSVVNDKPYTGDFGDGKSDLYTLDVDGEKLSKFIDETSIESSFVGLQKLTGKVLFRNGITLDLVSGTLKYLNNEQESIDISTQPIKLLSLLMSNDGLVTFKYLYQELGIEPDGSKAKNLNGNLRKIKYIMCQLLKNVGVDKDLIKSIILIRNKLGLVMVDQK